MVKIQLDLTPEEDSLVELYKISNKLKTKQAAVKSMIHYFQVEIKPKNIKKEAYFKW